LLEANFLMRKILAVVVFSLVCVTLIGAGRTADSPASGTNWPRWRGSDGSGVSETKNLPAEWSDTKNVIWKTPIPGRGHSSPIIWGNRLFLTTSFEGEAVPGAKAPVHLVNGKPFLHPDSVGSDRRHTLKVLAIDTDSGKILWERTAYEGTVYDDRHRKNTYASSTPATDGERVYVYFGSEGLYAYDFNGNLLWKTDVGKIGTVGMGVGTSPVLYENLVILQCDTEMGEDSFIVAFDKKTGKQVWRTPRKVLVGWSTPVVVRAGKRNELITSGTELIISYDPATGKELWRTKGVDNNAIPSPVVGHGLVILSTGFPGKKVIAVKLDGKAKGEEVEIVWTYDRGTAYVPSPVLYGDYLYLTTDKGILSCLDVKTGKVFYADGRIPVPATFTASLLAFDGKVFQFSEDGDAFAVTAGPKHEVVRTNPLGEPILATPAIAGGRLFIRGEKHLFAIGAK
jgi:outer membrane protein assembly factor BamB